ncbi:MAG: alpha/beta fold hydrolase [Pseudomonadota bacterium]
MNRDGKAQAPPVRRAYFECRYGQLHVHNTVPGGGGFDELTTVICLHGADETGRVFNPALQILGADRSVFAPDLPGHGESDPAQAVDAATAGALAIMDFISSMRIRSVDLVARGSGCDIAGQLAQAPESRVRRMVLITDTPPGQWARVTAKVTDILPLSASPMPALGSRLVQALSG